MMDRRTFLWLAGAAALGWRSALHATSGRSLERIGLQLYTIRHWMQKDFDGALAAVAETGYLEVELAGYHGRSAQEFKAALDRVGLQAPSTHVSLAQVRDQLPQVLEHAGVFGHRYVVCPWVDAHERTLDHWRRHAALFNRVGEACRAAGVRFAYHNHEFEFLPAEGKLPYDVLLEETDPGLVEMELDLFWITKGGQDPLRYFQQHPGRFPLVHVKDMDEASRMVDLGQGNIDFKRIFAHSGQAGIRHYFVEHDEPASPRESMRTSFLYLKQLRF